MTSFVHVEQPASHPGVVRAEALMAQIRRAKHRLDGARGLALLLLSAIVSSLLVVADKLMSTWTEGGLLVAWFVLWLVAFSAIAFFAGATRSMAARVVASVRHAARKRDAARADAQFLAYAMQDGRMLRDIQAIASRHEVEEPSMARVAATAPLNATAGEAQGAIPMVYDTVRKANLARYY
ncbi:MAG: hypothetical protein KKC79_00135 [Gammaproteobacteria bacterium]|nr:hypothetical protein [Gammaproteobacteria bacterium]